MLPYHPAPDPDAAFDLHSLVQASRDLGPGRDRDLVAHYLTWHQVRPRRDTTSAPGTAPLLALLRPSVVPALVLGGNLGLTIGAENMVQLLSSPGTDNYQQVTSILTILCAADVVLFVAALAAIFGVAACGVATWRATRPLRSAMCPALVTLAGAAVVEGLALGANAPEYWSGDFLLLLSAVAFLFFLGVALCSLALDLGRSVLRIEEEV